MIKDRRVDKPFLGFRFTHDVLWKGELVGCATEVQVLNVGEEGYTWNAFVRLNEVPSAEEAAQSDDIEQVLFVWDPAAGSVEPFRPRENCLTAQEVKIRGVENGGRFDLMLRDEPLPIPGVDQDIDQSVLDFLKRAGKRIVAW